jgi:hypothetical protein
MSISNDIKTQLNARGSAPMFACRAWVNFNGTGTVAIRASGNVSSITDNAAGDYTVNFTTAMPDGNYGIFAEGRGTAAGNRNTIGAVTNITTTAIRFETPGDGAAAADAVSCNVAIFR